jgi:serine/threonine protein kinase
MPLPAGSRLGRYEIRRQLGAGAMGEVYLAQDPQIDRPLAIKTVRLELVGEEDPRSGQLRLRLEREAKAAGRLVHPNVVTLFDAGEFEGLFYLAFEFVDGPDLASRMRQPPSLTLPEILRLGSQAAAALEAAHRVGIVHRDIKPSNILMAPDGSVKIADFGVAALIGQGTHLTQTGSLIGTPQYLAPEQVTTEVPIDGRSDLFSLGIVLYELLAWKRPFEGGTLAGLLYAIVSSNPTPLGEIRTDLPPRLTAAVMKLLEKDRERRFPSAAALRDELAAVEREMDSSSATTLVAPTPPTIAATTAQADLPPTIMAAPPAARKRVPVVAVGALLAVLLAGGTAAVYFRRNEPVTDSSLGKRQTPQNGTASSRPEPERQLPSTETTVAVPVIPVTSTSPAQSEETDQRPVGEVVVFKVSPPAAAAAAFVTIDGIPRGYAREVVQNLLPGAHRVRITASGFDPVSFEVLAQSGGPSEIQVDMAGGDG